MLFATQGILLTKLAPSNSDEREGAQPNRHMLIYVPALAQGHPVWVEDYGCESVHPVYGSITDTWRRVLQVTSNRLYCAFFLKFDEVNTMAGSEILIPGIQLYPKPECFADMRKKMLEWSNEKEGAFGFSVGMSHSKAANFIPKIPEEYVICGGLFTSIFVSTRDAF